MSARGLSLNAKVAVTLAAVFLGMVAVFLLVLVPLQRQQRQRLVERDQRLLATLRQTYERDLIYDVLSENEESLAADLAALARQPGVVWARLDQGATALSATATPEAMRALIGTVPDGVAADPAATLILNGGGSAYLMGSANRRVPVPAGPARARLPALQGAAVSEGFRELVWNGIPVLQHQAELKAADEAFGRLEILYSLAELERNEALTRRVFYALAGGAFLTLLVLLNLLISRIVIAPVRGVREAMAAASKGDLQVALPVTSRDEIGAIAASFNQMVSELAKSKRELDAYSRNLEEMVVTRTRELADLKNHLETVISHVGAGVIFLDAEGRVTMLNDRASEILGVPRSEAQGRGLGEVLGSGDAGRLAELASAALREDAPLRKAQLSLRLPQGRRVLSVVASALPAAAGQRRGAVVVFDDLTQILASQRLESWKEAVERVIHEIKNPLTPVGLSAQALRTAYAEDRRKFDEMFPQAIEMILCSVAELKSLIGEFTHFYRLPKVMPRPHDLNALVRLVIASYETGALEGIAFRMELAPELPPIALDPDQMRRVLLNIVNNGVEAMEGRRGELSVSTSGPDGTGLVKVCVTDQGPGIEDVERIFEPYYTTKVKGTGLGLLISQQIVEEHDGEIRVRSRLGTGTTVEILLPTVAHAALSSDEARG